MVYLELKESLMQYETFNPYVAHLSFKHDLGVLHKLLNWQADSLVNGAIGEVIDFVFHESKKVKAVIVKFDNPEVGVEQRRNHCHLST